jgi:hypothetical protein
MSKGGATKEQLLTALTKMKQSKAIQKSGEPAHIVLKKLKEIGVELYRPPVSIK